MEPIKKLTLTTEVIEKMTETEMTQTIKLNEVIDVLNTLIPNSRRVAQQALAKKRGASYFAGLQKKSQAAIKAKKAKEIKVLT